MIHEEDEEALVLVAVRLQDLTELAEAATAVAGLGDGLEVAEEVHTMGRGPQRKP